MKVEKRYTIELEESEAKALKVILGKRSLKSDTENGLSPSESKAMFNLYDQLPDSE